MTWCRHAIWGAFETIRYLERSSHHPQRHASHTTVRPITSKISPTALPPDRNRDPRISLILRRAPLAAGPRPGVPVEPSGKRRLPDRRCAVQALRSTRLVGAFAYGRKCYLLSRRSQCASRRGADTAAWDRCSPPIRGRLSTHGGGRAPANVSSTCRRTLLAPIWFGAFSAISPQGRRQGHESTL